MKWNDSNADFDAFDWNFDAVPDGELIACCYWEYARESVFMRQLCQRCTDGRKNGVQPDEQLWADLEKLPLLGYAVEIFVPGYFYFLEPYTTAQRVGDTAVIPSRFPAPWQMLEPNYRSSRARIRTSREANALVPFQRGPAIFAKWIAESYEVRKTGSGAGRKSTKDPKNRGSESIPPVVIPSLFSAGSEIGVFEIKWAQFANDEIATSFRKWLKANRPHDIPGPDNKGRNKYRDWRVALERLGMMRLLHHFRLRDLPEATPSGWKRYQKREWYKERKRAGEMFRRLFPFVPESERPLCWPTDGGRSR